VIAWAVAFTGGPVAIAAFFLYLCRGPSVRHMSDEQIKELAILSEIERSEDLHLAG
jgi:hypothetical protein